MLKGKQIRFSKYESAKNDLLWGLYSWAKAQKEKQSKAIYYNEKFAFNLKEFNAAIIFFFYSEIFEI